MASRGSLSGASCAVGRGGDTITVMDQAVTPEALSMSEDALEGALADLEQCDDAQLRAVISVLQERQRSRAQSRGDLDALVEMGFDRGFDSSGRAKAPWVSHGVIICPGSVQEKSSLSHDCSFAHVGEDWIWECGELLVDEVRRGTVRGRIHQRSVSLVGAIEGMALDVLVSKKRQNQHQLQGVTSYLVSDGALVLVDSRTVRTAQHR